jgi:hypothetical protein
MSNVRYGAFMVMLLVVASGCGGNSTETTSVSGKVTVSDKTLESGVVRFLPAAGGRPLFGTIDASGYKASLPPGDYTVVIQPSAHLPEGWQEGDPVPPPKVQVPAIYTQPHRSPLTLTVVAGPPMKEDFDLK